MRLKNYIIEKIDNPEKVNGVLFPSWINAPGFKQEYLEQKIPDKIKMLMKKLPASIAAVIKDDIVWDPYGKKETTDSSIWMTAWFNPRDKSITFPRGWLFNLDNKKFLWTLLHELAHIYHYKKPQILKEFLPFQKQAMYMKKIHSNKKHLTGELFADSVAEYVVNPNDLKANAPEIYNFMKTHFG